MTRAVTQARAAGWVGRGLRHGAGVSDVIVHRGAGAYICGEETAIMESLEGRRGHPRTRPPFPTTAGLYGMPTVIQNLETVANVVPIAAHGGAWFARIGAPGCPGTKICSVSGRVRRPGNYEVETGTPLAELILEHAGGPEEGHALKFVLPAGASSAPVLPRDLDVPLDHEALLAVGSMLGSAGMVVCDDRDCAVAVAHRGRPLLPPRVVRQVHPVPRGHGVGRIHPAPPDRGRGPAGRRGVSGGSLRRHRRPPVPVSARRLLRDVSGGRAGALP